MHSHDEVRINKMLATFTNPTIYDVRRDLVPHPKLPHILCKGKRVQLQAWTCPEGSRKLRLPDFVTTARDGGRLSALPPRKCSWYSLLLEAESTPGP